jgi:hypothetical protein
MISAPAAKLAAMFYLVKGFSREESFNLIIIEALSLVKEEIIAL